MPLLGLSPVKLLTSLILALWGFTRATATTGPCAFAQPERHFRFRHHSRVLHLSRPLSQAGHHV